MSKGNKQGNAVAAAGKTPFNMTAVEEELEATEVLPVPVQRRVNALKNLHKEHLTLEKQYRDEVAALERKYLALYSPIYLKRSTIVNGEYEPTEAEVKIEGEEELAKAGDKEKDIKGIPKFWLTVMKNNSALGETITPADEGALEFLQDVKYANLEGDKQGFSISFHFRENPYFTDSVLTKVYYLSEDDMYNELVFDHAEGAKINWKPSKNLTVKLVKKQPKGGRGGRGRRGGAAAAARATTVEEPCDSFFNFFSPPTPPTADADDEDEDDEEAALIDDMLEADFEMGCILKDKLVPHSVLWFTGEAQEYEDEFGDDFDYDFDDEDDDDEEDDDEEEEEEEERPKKGRGGPPPKKSAGGKGGNQLPAPSAKGAPGPQPQQPECKQQ